MNPPLYSAAFTDADFAFLVGTYESKDVLVDVLPKLVGMLYIHKHVFDNELFTPQRVRDQLTQLINNGQAKVIDRVDLVDMSPIHAATYDHIVNLLHKQDSETRVGRKNWGEVVSVAAAKAMGVPLFLSNEGKLQSILDQTINSGSAPHLSSGDVQVFRIVDFVLFMRDIKESRKAALWIWVKSGYEEDVVSRKAYFKRSLWPTEPSLLLHTIS